jgi:hypothetical protein
MHTRLLSGCAAVVAAVVFLAGSPRAQADTMTLYFDHTNSQTAHITYNGSASTVTPGPYYWKDPPSALNANTTTFCVQLDQFISQGSTYTYQKTPLASMPTIGNQTKADYISELFGRYYSTAWNNPSFTGNTASTAFQLALWELVYDGPVSASNKGTLDLTKGVFKDTASADASAVSLAQMYLTGGTDLGKTYAALSGDTSQFAKNLGGYQLVGLTEPPPSGQSAQPGFQDQLVLLPTSPVPAPAGVWLAGLGLVALIGRGRFLRKKAPPAETAA